MNRLLIENFRFIILSFRLLKSIETFSVHASKIRIINKKLLFKPFKTDLFNIIYTDFINIYLKIALKIKKYLYMPLCSMNNESEPRAASSCGVSVSKRPGLRASAPTGRVCCCSVLGSCPRRAPFPIPSPISA